MSSLKYLLVFFALQMGAQDILEFSNGSKWLGQVKEFNKDSLSLKSELSAENLPFKNTYFKSIQFAQSETVLKKSHTIHLTNGDILPGNLIGMNEKQLTVDTTFAGVLILPKTLVKKIQYNTPYVQTAKTIWPEQYSSEKTDLRLEAKYDFKHPTLIEVTVSGKEQYASFNLRARKKARDEYFRIEFELIQYGNYLQAHGTLHSNRNGPDKQANKSIANVGDSPKMQVYVNLEKGLFMFYVDGKEVAVFDVGADFVGEERAMVIRAGNRTLLNSFNVAKWDGNKPIFERTQFSEKDKAQITLRNGDVAWGTITNINKEKLRFKSVLGDLSIPISSVSTITLTNPIVTPTQNNFTLSREGLRISGNISLKDDMLQVSNFYLSKAKLKKEHFRSLNRVRKPQKYTRSIQRVKKQVTLSVGKNVIKANSLKLKNGLFEVESNNLVGKQQLNSQLLTAIKFSGSNYRSNNTAVIQQRKSRRSAPIKSWTIDLTNGDFFQTTKYSLQKDSLAFDLGQFPITVSRSQIQKISVNQKRLNDKDFLQSLPDRYSLHFSLDLSDDIIKALKNDIGDMYPFIIESNSKTQRRIFYFYARLESASMRPTVGNRNWVSIPIKTHNKMIIKNRNHMEIKFDHKKGLIEVWANKLLISSAGDGKTVEKFKSLYIRNKRAGVVTGPIHFRPWDTINAKNYVIDKDMKVNEGTISAIDAKNVTLGTKKIKLDNLSEIIFNSANAKVANKKMVSITSKNGTFHVKNLEIEDSKVIFKYGSNPKMYLPFDQLRNIKFIDKPSNHKNIK